MNIFNIHHAKLWAKKRVCFLAQLMKILCPNIKALEMPNISLAFKLLYLIQVVLKQTIGDVLRIIYVNFVTNPDSEIIGSTNWYGN